MKNNNINLLNIGSIKNVAVSAGTKTVGSKKNSIFFSEMMKNGSSSRTAKNTSLNQSITNQHTYRAKATSCNYQDKLTEQETAVIKLLANLKGTSPFKAAFSATKNPAKTKAGTNEGAVGEKNKKEAEGYDIKVSDDKKSSHVLTETSGFLYPAFMEIKNILTRLSSSNSDGITLNGSRLEEIINNSRYLQNKPLVKNLTIDVAIKNKHKINLTITPNIKQSDTAAKKGPEQVKNLEGISPSKQAEPGIQNDYSSTDGKILYHLARSISGKDHNLSAIPVSIAKGTDNTYSIGNMGADTQFVTEAGESPLIDKLINEIVTKNASKLNKKEFGTVSKIILNIVNEMNQLQSQKGISALDFKLTSSKGKNVINISSQKKEDSVATFLQDKVKAEMMLNKQKFFGIHNLNDDTTAGKLKQMSVEVNLGKGDVSQEHSSRLIGVDALKKYQPASSTQEGESQKQKLKKKILETVNEQSAKFSKQTYQFKNSNVIRGGEGFISDKTVSVQPHSAGAEDTKASAVSLKTVRSKVAGKGTSDPRHFIPPQDPPQTVSLKTDQIASQVNRKNGSPEKNQSNVHENRNVSAQLKSQVHVKDGVILEKNHINGTINSAKQNLRPVDNGRNEPVFIPPQAVPLKTDQIASQVNRKNGSPEKNQSNVQENRNVSAQVKSQVHVKDGVIPEKDNTNGTINSTNQNLKTVDKGRNEHVEKSNIIGTGKGINKTVLKEVSRGVATEQAVDELKPKVNSAKSGNLNGAISSSHQQKNVSVKRHKESSVLNHERSIEKTINADLKKKVIPEIDVSRSKKRVVQDVKNSPIEKQTLSGKKERNNVSKDFSPVKPFQMESKDLKLDLTAKQHFSEKVIDSDPLQSRPVTQGAVDKHNDVSTSEAKIKSDNVSKYVETSTGEKSDNQADQGNRDNNFNKEGDPQQKDTVPVPRQPLPNTKNVDKKRSLKNTLSEYIDNEKNMAEMKNKLTGKEPEAGESRQALDHPAANVNEAFSRHQHTELSALAAKPADQAASPTVATDPGSQMFSGSFSLKERVEVIENLMNKLSDRVFGLTKKPDGEQKMILNITPDAMGNIKIKLSQKDHKFNISFEFANPETKALLEKEGEHLREILKEKNVLVASIEMKESRDGDSLLKSEHREQRDEQHEKDKNGRQDKESPKRKRKGLAKQKGEIYQQEFLNLLDKTV